MAKGYIIARATIDDDEAYARYAAGAGIAMKKYGARVLARGGRSEALEGAGRPRNVILEFETYELACAYYHSDDYQAARQHRVGKAAMEIVVVEGYDGPQPSGS